MEKVLQLVFRNAEDSLFTLNLFYPREDLTEQEVDAVMDLILAKNIFLSTGGALVKKVRARLVARDVVDIATYAK